MVKHTPVTLVLTFENKAQYGDVDRVKSVQQYMASKCFCTAEVLNEGDLYITFSVDEAQKQEVERAINSSTFQELKGCLGIRSSQIGLNPQ